MTGQQLQTCIAENRLHAFYTSSAWLRLRAEVLAADKNECQRCRARGWYRRANTVHHVNPVRERPDLALSLWYTAGGGRKRNLVSLCHACHEAVHGHRHPPRPPPLTVERW